MLLPRASLTDATVRPPYKKPPVLALLPSARLFRVMSIASMARPQNTPPPYCALLLLITDPWVSVSCRTGAVPHSAIEPPYSDAELLVNLCVRGMSQVKQSIRARPVALHAGNVLPLEGQ